MDQFVGPPDVSTENLDYLLRADMPARLPPGFPLGDTLPALRRMSRITRIGRLDKSPNLGPGQSARLLTEDLTVGLCGYNIPFAFLVSGNPTEVSIEFGTWAPADRHKWLDDRLQIVNTLLKGLYLAIELVPAEVELYRWPLAGLALGIPTAKLFNPVDGALPIDRLIRALSSANWAMLILAEPVDESVIRDVRHSVINEMRSVKAAAQAAKVPSPLAEHYTQLLQVALTNLTQGQATGAWRTAVYLLGDMVSYHLLASVFRGIFSGDQSLPEPVRVWPVQNAVDLAVDWAMPAPPAPDGPGLYNHPFSYQTLLTSAQLAAYAHLPQLETSGFSVALVPDFDAVPPTVSNAQSIEIGKVIHRTYSTLTPYNVSLPSLSRHAFVAGVTGSGKTNTIFHLLKQADAAGVPFLVIEPAKAEYRALLDDPQLADRLQVFTLGDERVSPFRVNPFEVVGFASGKTAVSEHLDLLRSVFGASFGMWTPLPQVLEKCLHQVYADRGWDITSNLNHRLDQQSDTSAAFPTLSDLVLTIDDVAGRLGYEDKITADIRAALTTRIDALRTGGKGRMLDVQRSFPMKALLERPTILELQDMGDDDDKAFLMGLLLVRVAEYRRGCDQFGGLRHILVIEEAHRLLANVGTRKSEEEADPRGKAVETFGNLLSEIRSYGQSVLVADQIPVKLASEIMKNTSLKIAHRVVASDDRAALGGAMAMSDRQALALATLMTGQAAVFSEGDDAPVLVQVPQAKDQAGTSAPNDERIREHMDGLKAKNGDLKQVAPSSSTTSQGGDAVSETARRIVEDRSFRKTFARTILSTVLDETALDRMWDDLVWVILSKAPAWANVSDLHRAVFVEASHWLAMRRGAQAGWSYSQTEAVTDKLTLALLEKLEGGQGGDARRGMSEYVLELFANVCPPLPGCAQISDEIPACPFRYAAADLINLGDYKSSWQSADESDSAVDDGRRPACWEVCLDAAYELVEWPEAEWSEERQRTVTAVTKRAGLCFAQELLIQDQTLTPRTVRRILEKLYAEAYNNG